MEVILREHVDNLGRRGEIVKVADGYARNYLLPRKLALLVTDGNKKQIERERVKFDAQGGRGAEGRRGDGRAAGERRGRDRAQGRRDRGAVRLGHDGRHRRGAGRQGLRDRSPQAAAAPSRSRSSASTTCRSSCTATSPRSVKVKVVAEGRQTVRSQKSEVDCSRVEIVGARSSLFASGRFSFSRSTSPFSSCLVRCPRPPSPNARCRTISKPSAPSSARSCCTTTRSTSPPR